MKTALIIAHGIKQVMLTPENDEEKAALKRDHGAGATPGGEAVSAPTKRGWHTRALSAWMVVNRWGEFSAVYGSKDSAKEWAEFANATYIDSFKPYRVVRLAGSIRIRSPQGER